MIRLSVWFAERCMEIVIVTTVIMITERPSRGVGGGGLVEEFLRTTAFGLLFYVISGYLASCVYFGLIIRQNSLIRHVFTFALAFVVHAAAFFIMSSDGIDSYALRLGAFGLATVIIANWLGAIAYKQLSREN